MSRSVRLRLLGAFAIVVISAAVSVAAVLVTGEDPRQLRFPSSERIAQALSYDAAAAADRAAVAGVGREPERAADQVHVHASLRLLVNGVPTVAPQQMGHPDDPGAYLGIHAHDASGIVHLHQRRGDGPFTLGQVFAVWGPQLTADGIGELRRSDGWKMRMWVNGRRAERLNADLELTDETDVIIDLASEGFGLAARQPLPAIDWKVAARLLEKGRAQTGR